MPLRRITKALLILTPLALVALAILWPHFRGTAHADSTGFRSPTFPHAPNEWANPERAFTNNDTFASETVDTDQQGYSEFGFDIPGGSFILGIAVQLNAWAPTDPTECEILVQLSGNDGGGFTSAQTAELDDDEDAVHTLGGSTDLWSTTWAPDEFSDLNFVARIQYNDTVGCTDTTEIRVDHIQVNVYYKAPDDSGFHSPSSTIAPNDEWTSANNAFTSNGAFTTSDQDGDDQGYDDFNIGVPAASIITGVEVRAEALSEDNDGCELKVRFSGASGFGGLLTAELGDTEEVHTLGGPEADWGHGDLVPEDFTNANFVLEIRNVDPDPGSDTDCDDGALTSVDHLQVKVYYKEFEQSGKNSPSATHEPNAWADSDDAFTSNDLDATTDVDDAEQGYSGFSITIPIDSLIVGIEVQVEASSEDADGCELIVRLSGDGGDTYSEPRVAELTTTQATIHTVGGLDDLWGNTWSVAHFSDANFVLKVINNDPDGACTDSSETFLDHIQVNVYYKDLVQEGFAPPSATHLPNGDWADPQNAFTSNDLDATNSVDGEEQGYANFGLTVPDGSIITGIEALVEASSSDPSGCELDVALSWNDGVDYTEVRTASLTNSQVVDHLLGGTADTWGRDWIADDFDNGNFVVVVTNVDPGAECDDNPTVFLDLIEINVYWKTSVPPPTNTPTITNTATATNTTGPSSTPTDTSTPLATLTPTITATPTITDTPTATNTPTITNTPTRTNTPTNTLTPTNTPTRTSTPTPEKDLGDVNDDGLVNAIDALLILQFNARLLSTLPNPSSADVNLNDVINAVDAALILQFTAGLLGGLPPE